MRRVAGLLVLLGCNAPVGPLDTPGDDITLAWLGSGGGVTLQGTAVGPDDEVLLVVRHGEALTFEDTAVSRDRGTSWVRVADGGARSEAFTFEDVEVVRTAWGAEPVVAAGFRRTISVLGETLVAQGGFDAFVARVDSRRVLHFASPADTFVNAIAVDALDQLYVAGRFAGSLQVAGRTIAGDGTDDAFVAKIRDDEVAWILPLASAGRDAISGIAVTPTEGVYVTGTVDGELDLGAVRLTSDTPRPYLLEIDPFGAPVRGVVFGGDGSAELAVLAVDERDGTLWGAATFRGTIDVGGRFFARGRSDVLVLRFAPGLRGLEVMQHGGDELDVVETGAVDRYGRFWITGSTRGPTSLAPGRSVDDGLDGFLVAFRGPDTPTFRRRIGGAEDQVGAGVGTPGGGVVRFTLQTDGPFELVGAPMRTAPGVYLGRYPD